jgi:hypothetical protein
VTESIIRLAAASDEDEIMALCQELHSENGLFPMSEQRVREMLRRCWDRKGGLMGLIGAPGAIEAMMLLLISSYWYTDQWHLEELFSYVRPSARRSTHAKTLVAWAKRASDEIGIPLVIGILSNTRTEAKVRLYRRQLQDPAGAFFVYGPTQWRPQPAAKAH